MRGAGLVVPVLTAVAESDPPKPESEEEYRALTDGSDPEPISAPVQWEWEPAAETAPGAAPISAKPKAVGSPDISGAHAAAALAPNGP